MSESLQQSDEEMQMQMEEAENKKEGNLIIAKFQEKMEELNTAFLTAIQKALSENPSQSLIPLIKDYLHYHRALLIQHALMDDSSPPKTFQSLGVFWGDIEKCILAEIAAAAAEPETETNRKRKIGNVDDGPITSSATTTFSESPEKKFAALPNSIPFANFNFAQSDTTPVQIVQEKDAQFSTRCKIYEITKENFPNLRGVGMLYVKKLEGNRYQLLVRADNSQGKVLLNIPVQTSLPIKMKGADAIATMDVNPGEGKQAVPIVIRTASSADADKLFEKLKEIQGA